MKKWIQKIAKYTVYPMVFITPFVLWMLPASFFDSAAMNTCPSVVFFNVECFGCGMTRAVMHFHHFEYPEALFYNYGVVLIYPFLVYFWFVIVHKGLYEFGILQKKEEEVAVAP